MAKAFFFAGGQFGLRKNSSIKTKTVSCNTRRLYVITVEDLPDKKRTFKRSNMVFEVQNNGFTQIFCPVSLPHGQI
ncbi:hypothetical protein [Chitinophaga sp.]|uniref:hypothetical protein n=1 Tax=Chitinophaga sp. TaxID=1869181 RepID=UPI0031E0067E